MENIILKYLDKSNRRSKAIAEMVKSLILSRSVSSTKCANYLSGIAKKTSKIKRVERFYARNYVKAVKSVDFLCDFMGTSNNILSLDRSNWEYGNCDINALVLYGINESSSSMLNLKVLENKGGNSNFDDRKKVLSPVIKKLDPSNITALLCDREFFSFKFVSYLIKKDIPFVIRIKENLGFIQPLIRSMKNTVKTVRNVSIGKSKNQAINLDLSGKKLKDEYLLTVSYKVNNPLKLYRKRWSIECFFKSIKSAGFNIEATHMKQSYRLRSLFLLCGMAYTICIILGIFRHKNVARLAFKKTLNCYQFSFFRYGLDWITELIFSNLNSLSYNALFNDLLARVR